MRFVNFYKSVPKKYIRFIFLFCIFLGASLWLMIHTFSYDTTSASMAIGALVWSDFASHVPLIRSFSMGSNFPVEFPLFAGEPIKYHYLFYFVAGLLERIGFRIDWALNIPSALGFTALLLLIYYLAVELTDDHTAAFLSILFFFFNGSMSFLKFFEKFPLSPNTLSDIRNVRYFPSFAPWDGGEILAFWNLNIYTNQRHLAAAFALVLAYIYMFLRMDKDKTRRTFKKTILIGLSVGIFRYFHQPSLLIALVIFGVFFIFFPQIRKHVFVAGVVATVVTLPQILTQTNATANIEFYPWFYLHDNISFLGFFRYWFLNIGLHMLFIPLGVILGDGRFRKTMTISLLLFILVNTFKFSPELAGSHKLLNFALILGNISTAWFIVHYKKIAVRVKSLVARSVLYFGTLALVFALILSGVIDFFVVLNNYKVYVDDIGSNKVAAWIANDTSPDAVFINSTYLYNPANIAGRKIFYGWPYFTWGNGHDSYSREKELKEFYAAEDVDNVCYLVGKYDIGYVEVDKESNIEGLVINRNFFENNLIEVYEERDGELVYYSTEGLCN